ncbi:helix-turn-helix domain-containing protein [Ruegeria halocynthiae]|uniref:helix-turn-helix domain-containing protein n=1 Tax=Ruegeria halocynthiae TaxID=985054 RepID=UPI00068DAEF1|nr:helix-turn-helix domain-containing protein [Ruegeria halocynthiae]
MDGVGEQSEAEVLLGPKLRKLRKNNGLSLQELALRSDVSVGALSQIERGLSQPSVRTLQKIGHALGVPLTWMFDKSGAEDDAADGIIVRKGKGATLKVPSNGINKVLLTPLNFQNLQLMVVKMEPHSTSGDGAYTHEGLDAGLVLSGCLNLEVDGRIYVLGVGDSFAFDSNRPHRFENRGGAQAEILWVNTESAPEFIVLDEPDTR